VEEVVVAARAQHPHWGPVKLRAWLDRTSSA
jgi:predicted nucleotidyltransferase